MDEESRQKRLLILLAALVCAVMIGYNAFYVPDATLLWAQNSSSYSSVNTAWQTGDSSLAESAESSRLNKDSSSSHVSQEKGKININTASAQELSDGLNGIGDVLAERIVEDRENNGPFCSVEDVKRVPGIGDKILEKIRGCVTIS
ncbi:MAG: helix-hairpin-helix domain-containing protein [Oscillospiraceae bacterium]|jgi:competence ComEA-like helix-hairpin-helix protein|nr:helix-hairpin-helix domain-containing protein [Oscillospiraceae bacterium]